MGISDHTAIDELCVGRAARDIQIGGHGGGGGGVLPRFTVIRAVLPLIGQVFTGSFNVEICAGTLGYNGIHRLRYDRRRRCGKDHTDGIRGHASGGVTDHAAVNEICVGGAARDIQIRGSSARAGGVLPRFAVILAVLPLIGQIGAGCHNVEIRAGTLNDRGVDRLRYNGRRCCGKDHADGIRGHAAGGVGDHAAISELCVGGAARDIQIRGSSARAGGVLPRFAVILAVLPLIGQIGAGCHNVEIRAGTLNDRGVDRLRYNGRRCCGKDHADGIRGHAAGGVGDHAAISELCVGGAARDIQIRGSSARAGGVLPGFAVIRAVLPPIGQIGAGSNHMEIRAGALRNDGVDRLGHDRRRNHVDHRDFAGNHCKVNVVLVVIGDIAGVVRHVDVCVALGGVLQNGKGQAEDLAVVRGIGAAQPYGLIGVCKLPAEIRVHSHGVQAQSGRVIRDPKNESIETGIVADGNGNGNLCARGGRSRSDRDRTVGNRRRHRNGSGNDRKVYVVFVVIGDIAGVVRHADVCVALGGILQNGKGQTEDLAVVRGIGAAQPYGLIGVCKLPAEIRVHSHGVQAQSGRVIRDPKNESIETGIVADGNGNGNLCARGGRSRSDRDRTVGNRRRHRNGSGNDREVNVVFVVIGDIAGVIGHRDLRAARSGVCQHLKGKIQIVSVIRGIRAVQPYSLGAVRKLTAHGGIRRYIKELQPCCIIVESKRKRIDARVIG